MKDATENLTINIDLFRLPLVFPITIGEEAYVARSYRPNYAESDLEPKTQTDPIHPNVSTSRLQRLCENIVGVALRVPPLLISFPGYYTALKPR